jgi:aerobic-type carbon monoxide dehydrogenase small subunit (CoxS/CutS family)
MKDSRAKDTHAISLQVNGRRHELAVEARRTLADVLRHDLGYTGTHLGCEHGICGACTVMVDGAPVRACLVFGVQADGAEVRTVEGLADGEQLSDLQQAFSDHHALQCGFCTPGFLMLAEAYLADADRPAELTEEQARELLTPDEMPHQRPITTLRTDLVLDTGDYPALLAAAAREADRLGYRTLAGGAARGEPGRGGLRGFGLAMFVEKSGLGPHETADVTVSKSGAVHVYCGGTSMGQGIETVLAQIAADALGADPGAVRVVAGDTAAQPFGAGSWASRTTVVGGSAVHQAATAVRERAVQLAARLLEAAEDDLDLAGGSVTVRGDPALRLTLAEIARAAEPASGYLRPASRPACPPAAASKSPG